MVIIRYIVEYYNFFKKLINRNYKLIWVNYYQFIIWEKLNTSEGRKTYLLNNKEYDWGKLKNSLTVVGYIPSIMVCSHKTHPESNYEIMDGNHRFFILSENKKPHDKIKVWLNLKNSKIMQNVLEEEEIIKKKIEDNLKELNKTHLEKIKKSPNYNRLKDIL